MAAGLLGVHAVVVMPATAVRSKVEACRGYGAEVILEGADTAEAWAAMERIRDARGLTFVHPFDHVDTITGQGTVGLEIVEDLPDVDVVVAGVGGRRARLRRGRGGEGAPAGRPRLRRRAADVERPGARDRRRGAGPASAR